jgi:hypothetical protein
MTLKLPFTESAVRRAIEGARKAGLKVNAVTIGQDGSITVHEGEPPKSDPPKSKWAD